NIFLALKAVEASRQPQIVLLDTVKETVKEDLLSSKADRLLCVPLSDANTGNGFHRRVSQMKGLFGLSQFTKAISKNGIDLVFTDAFNLPPRCFFEQCPIVAWIHDFQHIHLPEAFSPDERRFRDYLFAKVADRATRIVVTNNVLVEEFRNSFPENAQKVRLLKLMSYIPPTDPMGSSSFDICNYYNLPSEFFYLPNAFTKHKNHRLVLETLSLLKAKNCDPTVVCTGYTADYRSPDYFPALLAEISALGLRQNFIILGHVPYRDVNQLMRQSLAVLQPSLYEGFGLSVSEAISLGKNLILSDIPAHREKQPPNASFFNPKSPEELAEALQNHLSELKRGHDPQAEITARQQMDLRLRELGENFMSIALDAVHAN